MAGNKKRSPARRCLQGLALLILSSLTLPDPATAASIVASPSSGAALEPGDSIHVVITLELLEGEAADAFQVAIDLDTNQDIFTVENLTGSLSFDFNQAPNIQTSGESGVHQINAAAFNFATVVAGATSIQIASFDLVSTGVPGMLVLSLYPSQSFYAQAGVINANYTGTVGTYISDLQMAINEAPVVILLALILVGAPLLRRSRP